MTFDEFACVQSRRGFLQSVTAGVSTAALAHLLGVEGRTAATGLPNTDPMAPRAPHYEPRAKSVILLYMSGGVLPVPVVFRGPNGAAARVAAQHSQCYASWFAHVPGWRVVAPYSAADAKGLLKSAIRDPNPVVFLENELLYGQSFEVPDGNDHLVPIGEAALARAGSHATVAAFSIMVGRALEAAETLAAEGIEVEVVDLRSLRPLDGAAVLASVEKTNRLVTVEEGWPFAGIGAEVAALVMEHAFDMLDAPVARVSGADIPMPYAANLEAATLPGAKDIADAVRRVCYRS